MFLKRLLLLIPAILILGLGQSYFWVPTYEKQTAGSEDRLEKFISAISGDARLLNPIVSADSASGAVVINISPNGLLMRFVDVMLAFPSVVLAIAIATLLADRSVTTVIIAVGIVNVPTAVIRGRYRANMVQTPLLMACSSAGGRSAAPVH